MVAQPIKVCPPALLEAAESVATTTEQAAAPYPGSVPVAAPGSPPDGAWAAIAAGIASQAAQMAAGVAGDGPRILAATESGIVQLQTQDERNAQQLQAVPQQEQWL